MTADRALFGLMERSLRRLALFDPAFGVRQAKAGALMLERHRRRHDQQARAYLERDDRDSAAAHKDARDECDAWASRLRAIVDHHSDRPSEDKAVGDDPTPQTKRKLRRDPLETLKRADAWRAAYHDAAREIEEVARELVDGEFHRKPPAIWRGGVSGGERGEYLSGRVAELYWDRYEPWSREMDAQPAVRSNLPIGLSKLDVALMVLLDGAYLNEIDSFVLQTRPNTAKAIVLEALERYCGYMQPEKQRETIREQAE